MQELTFSPSLSMEEIEQNFANVDLFSELMKGLEEALLHKKGGAAMNPNQALIEKLNRLSDAFKAQFGKKEGSRYFDKLLQEPFTLPLKWKIDASGMLWLDNVWICPARYVRVEQLENIYVNPVTMELPLYDCWINIIITKEFDKHEITGVERNVFFLDNEDWKDLIVRQVTGTMALSGFEMTDEDKNRIRELMEHPERHNDILQALIEKHTRRDTT